MTQSITMHKPYSLICITLIALSLLSSCTKDDGIGTQPDVIEGAFNTPLYLPPVIQASSAELTAGMLTESSAPGQSGLYGYHKGGIGPVIESRQGETANIHVDNALPEETNLHWHGILAPAAMDGHPDQVISAGQSRNYGFDVSQRANTAWYHPHVHEKTGRQLSFGLAGLWLHRDNQEAALGLPSGQAELPLVIQDARRDAAGKLIYAPTEAEIGTGYFGQHVTVNGVHAPVHSVKTRWYRLRIVNASTARIYNLALNNGDPLWVIGNDGGLLQTPEKMYSTLLSPGERLDILVDFRNIAVGSSVYVVSNPFQAGIQGKQYFKLLKFDVSEKDTDSFNLPPQLSSLEEPNYSSVKINRSFDIGISHGSGSHDAHASHGGSTMMTSGHTINGKIFDMQRIDEIVQGGALEIWEFDNTNGDEAHPMHIHGVHFRIISRTGGRGRVQPFELGWKDTALCLPGEKVRVLIKFDAQPGKYVFHCHNIEHGDDGMMLNLAIQ